MMSSLIEQLDDFDPRWRANYSPDPLEAAVEIGLLEPDVLDGTDYTPLDFNKD